MSIFWVPIVNPAAVEPRWVEPGGPAVHPPAPGAAVQPQSAQPQPGQPQSGQTQSAQSGPGQPATASPTGPTASGSGDAAVQAASVSGVPGAASGSVEELLRQLYGYLQAHAPTHPVLEPALPALGVAVRAYGLHLPALALNQAVAVYQMLEAARAEDPALPAP